MINLLTFLVLMVLILNLHIPSTGGLKADALEVQIQIAFEKAKKLDVFHHLNITKTLISEDDDLKIDFYQMPGLIEKMKQGQNRKLGLNESNDPFVTIEKGLFVRNFGSTHCLMFNKYNIYDKHMVIVTKRFESQNSKISLEDLTYAGLTAESLNGILYFNGGKISGASQAHKHLQVLPKEGRNLPIISQLLKYIESIQTITSKTINQLKMFKYPHFNFKHGIITFRPSPSNLGQQLFSAYQALYSHLIKQNQQFNGTEVGYNIIGCQNFLMMIIRKQQKAFGVSINALGYMGSILFQEGEEMESYFKQHLPSQILEEISFQ